MATLEQIEQALRAADSAGNADDARRLAQAYADARRQQMPGGADPGAGQAQPPSLAQREGRGYGLGARSVLQGAGSLVGALGGDAFNAYVVDPVRKAAHRPTMSGLITGEDEFQRSPSYREAAGTLADRLGLPQPQDSRERVLGDVGEALTGTGLTLGAGGGLNALAQVGTRAIAPITSRIGQFLTAQPTLQGVSTVTGAGAASSVREGGGSQGQQLAAGLVGGLSPGVASMASGAATRGVVRGASGEQMQRNITDFNALGTSPSVGQATQRPMVQGLENLLAGGPTSAGVMNRFATQQADDIGAGLQRQAQTMSPMASGERAGRAVERGIDTFRGNVGALRQALYWQADQRIPGNTGTPMQNTVRTLTELTTPNPGATATTARMVNPHMRQMLDDLQTDLRANGGQIPYESLRRIRTKIGEQMNDFSMTPTTPARQLSALYQSLSQDMEEVARNIGPDALQAARRANNYTRLSNNRLEQVQRVIDKNGGPESVFNAVMQGTKDGGTTLRSVMQSLPRDGQRAVTAAVIRRMGMPTPGQAGMNAAEEFSAATFLTNWNRVSPEAKRALFDRHGPQFSRNMDRIASVADNIKQGAKVFANPSGTANRAGAMTYGAALVASLFDPSMVSTTGLVGSGAGANYLARKMTDPEVVRWLANSTAMPVGSAVAQINALRRIGERNQDEEIISLADTLQREHAEREGRNP